MTFFVCQTADAMHTIGPQRGHHGHAQTKGKRMMEIREALAELQREARIRSGVYPRLVTQGKLSQGEADRRTKALRYALYLVEATLRDTSRAAPNITGE